MEDNSAISNTQYAYKMRNDRIIDIAEQIKSSDNEMMSDDYFDEFELKHKDNGFYRINVFITEGGFPGFWDEAFKRIATQIFKKIAFLRVEIIAGHKLEYKGRKYTVLFAAPNNLCNLATSEYST